MLAPRHQLPRFIERGKVQTLSCPVYTGDRELVVPSAGTFTLLDQDGGTVITGPVTNLGSNDFALAALDTSSKTLSDSWQEVWALTIAGEVHTIRREAALVLRSLYPVITDDDLERVHPGLSGYLPSSQTSWEPQRAEAWAQLQARLIGKGSRPNLILSSWSLRSVHLYWTLFLIADLLRVEPTGRWAAAAKEWGDRAGKEWDELTFRYDDDDDGDDDGEDAAVPTLVLSDLPIDWREP